VILAAQHFLGKSRQDLVDTLTRVLEGHQRQILGTLVVDDLYKNRTEFIIKVRNIAEPDLQRMGFELVSYTVASLSDEGGYLDCLGQTQLAKVKREAQEGTAKEENVTKIKISEQESKSRIEVATQNQKAEIAEAEASANAHTVRAQQDNLKNQADRDVNMQKAQIDTEVAKQRAIADQSGVIEMESQRKTIVVKKAEQEEERTRIEVRIKDEEAKKNAMIEQGRVGVAEIDARRIAVVAAGKVKVAEETARMVEVEAQGQSTAELVVAENQAKATVATAEGRAKATLAIGEVEATSTRMKGEAEAAALSAKLEAETSAIVRKYKEMGQAGVLSELFPHLPAIAGSISAPLSQTDRMTFITSDGSSATKVTNEVCTMLAQVPEAVESISGINLKGVMKNMVEREGGISGSSGTTV